MNLHGPVRAPETAGVGSATLTVALVGWNDVHVSPSQLTAAVVVPKFAFKTEPVSRRLVRSLPHPDRTAGLPIVVFTPDGRLIVSGYPSGVVQVLDPISGKELRTIETPRGLRGGFSYMQLSKDLRTLFVALDDSKFEPLQVGDKKTYFRRYSGETRVYDLSTGAQREPLKVEPRRGVVTLAVSPDAGRIATMELASGRTEDFANLRAIYLWDVATRRAVKLRDGYGDLRFSREGKLVYVTVNDDANKRWVLYSYSAATGKEVGRMENPDGPWQWPVFSQDGRRAAAAAVGPKTKKPIVLLYDPEGFQPQATLAADGVDGETRFGHVTFSPDGGRLAAVAKTTVYLWDVESRKVLKSWPLDTPGRVRYLLFDSDGQRLAASTWFIPPELQNARDETVTPQDYPQTKVYLIDVTTDMPEVIVCPHGWWGRPAFSPDGKLLAVGGAGATHIFDLGKN